MRTPPHLGGLVREEMVEAGWSVAKTAEHLGCGLGALLRLLNGKAEMSPRMAHALEAIGWGTARHWMRMQESRQRAGKRGKRKRSG